MLGLPAAFMLPDTLNTAEVFTVKLLLTITLFENVALAAVRFEPKLRLDPEKLPEILILPKLVVSPSIFRN